METCPDPGCPIITAGFACPTRFQGGEMVSNQILEARRIVGLAVLALALTGCSLWPHHKEDTAAPAPVAQSEPAAESAPAEDMTATEAATEGGGMPAESVASQANTSDLIKP